MRLKNGDYYTNIHSNKLYKLNEDKDSNWYLSCNDEEGYHETEKTSGRYMMRLVTSNYKKSQSIATTH